MAKSDGAVYIQTLLDTTGFTKGMNTVEKRVQNLSNAVLKLGGVIASVFAVQKLVQFGKKAIDLGSDLQEVQNVVDVTFTTMNEKVNEFAKNAAESAGLSETMAKRYAGTFGAMAKAFGFAEGEAFNMATSLTQLSGDVASFYNLTQDEAYTKLKSVFTGETESLKDLGVVMTQSALDSFAMAKGYKKTTQQMTEQEKVALRYSFVLDQLSTAQGDFARTSDSWANQTKILSLNFDSFKANIGQALINIFTPFLKVINQIVSKMAQLSSYFVAFSEMLVGKSTSGGGGSPGAVLEDMSSGYDDVADSAKKAEKAQNKYLSGLDEIRTFTSSKTDSQVELPAISTGSSTYEKETSNILQDELKNIDKLISDFQEKFPKLTSFLQFSFRKIKEIIQDLFKGDFFELGNDISELIVGIYNFFSDAIDGVDWKGIGNKIGEFLAGINWLEIIKAALTLKFNVWKAIAELWFGAFEVAPFETLFLTGFALLNFTPIGKLLAGKLATSIITAFSSGGFVSKIAEAFTLALGGAGSLNEAFTAIFGTLGATIAGILLVVGGAVLAVTNFLDMFNNGFSWFNEILMLVGIGIAALGAIILGVPATTAGVVAGIVAALATLVIAVKDNWEEITAVLSKVGEFLKNAFVFIFQDVFGNILKGILDGFIKNVQNIGNGIMRIFRGVLNFITGTFSGNWEKAWQGVVDIFGGIWDTLVSVAKAPFNLFIGAINGLISAISSVFNFLAEKLNSLSFDIPEFLGGGTIGIDIPTIPEFKIPYLATGAVIPPNAPFMAMLGDQKHGTNIEAPLDTIKQAVREVMGSNGNGVTYHFVAQLNGQTLFEQFINQAQLKQMSTGRNPLTEW